MFESLIKANLKRVKIFEECVSDKDCVKSSSEKNAEYQIDATTSHIRMYNFIEYKDRRPGINRNVKSLEL